jgi:hypothetical protein
MRRSAWLSSTGADAAPVIVFSMVLFLVLRFAAGLVRWAGDYPALPPKPCEATHSQNA